MRSGRHARARLQGRGFTLVELLVALLVMAILAAMAWQGLAGMLRAREGSAEALDRTLRLNTALVQWEQDLQGLVDVGVVPPLAFNGQMLLMTRRGEGGVVLVAWALRNGRWTRWTGPPIPTVRELQEAWLSTQGLLGNEAGHVTLAEGVTAWQLYKYLGGRKANMQSSGDIALPPAAVAPPPPASAASGAAPAPPVMSRELLPEAVEMVLTIDERTLTRVIGLGPAGTGS
jgi:general secretion pathway protein J